MSTFKRYIHVHHSVTPSELEISGFSSSEMLFASFEESGHWEIILKKVGISENGGYREYAIDVPNSILTEDVSNCKNKVLVINKNNQKLFNKDVKTFFNKEYTGKFAGGHNVLFKYMKNRNLIGIDMTSRESKYPPSLYERGGYTGEAIFIKNPGKIWLKEVCKSFNKPKKSPFVL